MMQDMVNETSPPIDRHRIEELCYSVRDIAAVVGLIEIAAANGDHRMPSLAKGIQKTAEIAGQRLEEIAAALIGMVESEVQS